MSYISCVMLAVFPSFAGVVWTLSQQLRFWHARVESLRNDARIVHAGTSDRDEWTNSLRILIDGNRGDKLALKSEVGQPHQMLQFGIKCFDLFEHFGHTNGIDHYSQLLNCGRIQ